MIRWLAMVVLCGCGPSFVAVRPTASGPGVTVRLTRSSHLRGRGPGGALFETVVENRGAAPLEIDRDAVLLETASGPRARVPGGWSARYRVEPGAHQRVRCLYRVADLTPGERVALDFTGALRRDGRPVLVESLELVVRSDDGSHRAGP